MARKTLMNRYSSSESHLNEVNVVGGEFAGGVAAEQSVQHLEDGVVELVLQNAHQVLLDGGAGVGDAGDAQDDAVVAPRRTAPAGQR